MCRQQIARGLLPQIAERLWESKRWSRSKLLLSSSLFARGRYRHSFTSRLEPGPDRIYTPALPRDTRALVSVDN